MTGTRRPSDPGRRRGGRSRLRLLTATVTVAATSVAALLATTASAQAGAATVTQAAAAAAASSAAGGGWTVTAGGVVRAYAGAPSYGSLRPGGPRVTAMTATPDGRGYWLATSTGRVAAFGDARAAGSAPTPTPSDDPVVAIVSTTNDRSYRLVTADGAVMDFGGARFYGSARTERLHVTDVVSAAATPDGSGYWLATADGHVLDFGRAGFFGSPQRLHQPLDTLAITADGARGYWVYGAHRRVDAFGAAASDPTGVVAPKDATGPAVAVTVAGRIFRFWPHDPTPGRGIPGGPVSAAVASATTFARPFAPTSIWNEPIPSSVTPTTDSDALVGDFVEQYENAYGTVNINTTSYSSPDYTVGADQPTVTVTVRNCQGGTWVDPALSAQLSAVPIPAGATPAAGTDSDMIVYQPATDTEWELWQAKQSDGAWTACAGGRLTDVSASSGVFPAPYGVAASGLSLLAGQIHLSDVASGSIDHALEVQIPDTEAGVVAAPADRSDGWSTAPDAIPEGTRFRLDPDLDLATLDLPPAAYEIAKALQTYGMVVSDTSGAVDFVAQDPSPQMAAGAPDPYDAWMGGIPSYALLDGIPWGQLQVISPTAP